MRVRDHELRSLVEQHATDPLCPRTPPDYEYRSSLDFLLREGEPFLPHPLPRTMPRGAAKLCYHNAIMLSCCRGFPFVEGVAINHGGIAFGHAWNLDARGRVIDVTWDEAIAPIEHRAYLGVRFSVARAHEATWHGDACILDDHHRGYPVLREPWEPEESPGDGEATLLAAMRDYLSERPAEVEPEQLAERVRRAWVA